MKTYTYSKGLKRIGKLCKPIYNITTVLGAGMDTERHYLACTGSIKCV